MKKISIILAALAACFSVSCTKEAPTTETQDPSASAGMKKVTITASIDASETKTSYDADGKFSWTEGDQIAIKGSDNMFYTFTTTETAVSAAFTGYIPEDVDLQKHALYPAESVTKDASSGYFYTVPEYKDLSESFSAEIPMSSYVSAGTYNFVHMTGAALLTFTNILDEVSVVDISIKSNAVRLSGTQEIWSGTPFTFTGATATNDSEKTFTRRVSVSDDNTVQLYLPYKGEFWDNCTINIVGYDADNNEYVLLKDKQMKGSSANVFTPPVVIPYAPLELPKYVPVADLSKVDWTAENVASVTNSSDSEDAILEDLKVVADDNYMYVWIKSAVKNPYDANYIDIYLSDGDAEAEGAVKAWDQWPGTLGIDIYNKEHKGTIDVNGNITSMTFSHKGNYENIEYKNEVVDGKINWYLIFPRDYIEMYKSNSGTVHVGFRLWKDWTNFAAIPARGWGQSMLEVTLP